MNIGPFEIRKLHSPRFYVRAWRLVVMYWPHERIARRIEIVMR